MGSVSKEYKESYTIDIDEKKMMLENVKVADTLRTDEHRIFKFVSICSNSCHFYFSALHICVIRFNSCNSYLHSCNSFSFV